MADSSLKITGLTAIANNTANTAVAVDTNFDLLVDGVNAIVETATGHDHDGVNSKSVSAGFASLTTEEFARAQIMDFLS